MHLRDAHVLITGGSKGIGAELARHLHAKGARLTLVARESNELRQMAASVGGVALAVDLSDHEQYEGLLARAEVEQGPLDVVVNNAALGATRHFGTLSSADVRRTLTTNLLAPLELCRQAVRLMVPRGRGAILNVSSIAGEFAVPHLATYGSSKAGLTMFSMDLQRDIRDTGVDVSAFILGSVPDTNIYNEGIKNETTQKLARQLEKFTGLTTDKIARKMVKSLEKDRKGLVTMPGTFAPVVLVRTLPIRLGDLMFSRGEAPKVDHALLQDPVEVTPGSSSEGVQA
jgi:short-subunit dehydrogenase